MLSTQTQNISDGLINTNLKIPYNAVKAAMECEKNVTWVNSGAGEAFAPVTSTLYFDMLGRVVQQIGIFTEGVRWGTQIRPKLWQLSIRLLNNIGSTVFTSRVVLVRAIQPGDTSVPPRWTDVFHQDNACSTYNAQCVADPRNLEILFDSGMLLLHGPSLNGSAVRWTRDLTITLPDFITTYKGNTGIAESVATNNLWLMIHNDATTANNLQYKFFSTVYYGI